MGAGGRAADSAPAVRLRSEMEGGRERGRLGAEREGRERGEEPWPGFAVGKGRDWIFGLAPACSRGPGSPQQSEVGAGAHASSPSPSASGGGCGPCVLCFRVRGGCLCLPVRPLKKKKNLFLFPFSVGRTRGGSRAWW